MQQLYIYNHKNSKVVFATNLTVQKMLNFNNYKNPNKFVLWKFFLGHSIFFIGALPHGVIRVFPFLLLFFFWGGGNFSFKGGLGLYQPPRKWLKTTRRLVGKLTEEESPIGLAVTKLQTDWHCSTLFIKDVIHYLSIFHPF